MALPGREKRSRDKKEEILGILLVAIGLLIALSLLPQPLVNRLAPAEDAALHNLIGMAGKFINESLKDLIGVLSYALPILLTVWGWRIFRGQPHPAYSRATVYSLVIFFAADIFLGLAGIPAAGEPLDASAGQLGHWLAAELITGLGLMGAWLVTVVALLIFLVLYAGLSLRTITDWLLVIPGAAVAAVGWVVKRFSSKAKSAPARKAKPSAVKPARAAAVPEEPMAEEERQREEREEDFEFNLGNGSGADGGGGNSAALVEDGPAGETDLSRELSTGLKAREGLPGEPPGYELPSAELLDPLESEKRLVSPEELQKMGGVLMAKLADFNVDGELVNITRGPQVSTFEIRPAPGVKVNRIAALSDDLAMAMHAKRVRILAPIPGKGAVGVELPNPVLEKVQAREIFESDTYRHSKLNLPIGLGKDLEGRIRVADLTRMPHLLVAGTTGSGKSVCMNMIIASLLYLFGPDRVRLLMVDPKMIELSLYNDIPHLLHPVVTDAKEAAAILKWTTFEMERRYRTLSRNSVRNIDDYNAKLASGRPVRTLSDDPEERAEWMPYIIILVDELSDLMCSEVKNEIEAGLVRLAQMARAVGIHLVVATQRPSVDVITGLIKANFPSRLSFQVFSKIDSRTILDVSGAEQLLRNGDMLFVPTGQADPIRIQGAYISSEEVERLAGHWRAQPWGLEGEEDAEGEGRPARAAGILGELFNGAEPGAGDDQERDELFAEAARLVVRHDQGSTSLIQRRLKVGYARAGRIVDQLERAGILGPPDGSKAREVLIREADLPDYGVE